METGALITFRDVVSAYNFTEDLVCSYELSCYAPQFGDRIVIFLQEPQITFKEYVLFEWAPVGSGTFKQVVFKSESLPRSPKNMYFMCYVTSKNIILSMSGSFQFLKDAPKRGLVNPPMELQFDESDSAFSSLSNVEKLCQENMVLKESLKLLTSTRGRNYDADILELKSKILHLMQVVQGQATEINFLLSKLLELGKCDALEAPGSSMTDSWREEVERRMGIKSAVKNPCAAKSSAQDITSAGNDKTDADDGNVSDADSWREEIERRMGVKTIVRKPPGGLFGNIKNVHEPEPTAAGPVNTAAGSVISAAVLKSRNDSWRKEIERRMGFKTIVAKPPGAVKSISGQVLNAAGPVKSTAGPVKSSAGKVKSASGTVKNASGKNGPVKSASAAAKSTSTAVNTALTVPLSEEMSEPVKSIIERDFSRLELAALPPLPFPLPFLKKN